MTKDAPVDPMTALAENATMMHELLISYVAAGFTRSEAMQVVLTITAEGMRAARENGSSTDAA
jgi:hypothetical protein